MKGTTIYCGRIETNKPLYLGKYKVEDVKIEGTSVTGTVNGVVSTWDTFWDRCPLTHYPVFGEGKYVWRGKEITVIEYGGDLYAVIDGQIHRWSIYGDFGICLNTKTPVEDLCA